MDDRFTLTFTLEQMRIIDVALGNMPYRESAPVIADINRQFIESQKGKALRHAATTDKELRLPEGASYDRMTLHNGMPSA